MIKAFTITLLFNLLLFAQSGPADINSIVNNQISEAKEKQKKEALVKDEIKQGQTSSSNISSKMYILGLTTVAAFGFVGYRRLKTKNDKKLKQNINLIRREAIIKKHDPKLRQIRTSLCGNDYYDVNEQFVNKRAKEYKIAQGEVLLAARIKSHSMMKNTQEIFNR